MPRTAILAPIAATLVTLALAAASPAAASVAASSVAASTPSGPSTDRVVSDPAITEASGLATSLRHRGVLWTLNDSGNSARLFALAPGGRTAATVRVKGAPSYDWEAIASYRDASGHPMLAVGDTGDNRAERSSVKIVVLPEPALADATVTPARVLRLTYPGGPVDAETLLVDPDGRRAFVVTKGFGSTVYQVPDAVWTSTTSTEGTLVKVASVSLLLVTDGVMGPGGHPVLRTYSDLAVLPPLTDDVRGGSLRPLAELRLPSQRQGEGLTLLDASTALVGSEGKDQAVIRVPLPDDVRAALGTGTSSEGGSTGAARATSPEGDGPGGRRAVGAPDGGPGISRPILVGGAVLVAGALLGLRRVRAGRR